MSTEVDIRKGTVRSGTFGVVRRVVAFLCRIIFGVRAKGQENIPTDGPFILVANHLHNLDPVFMLVCSTRPIFFMAKQELFEIPGIKQLITWVGAFPINRGKMDRTSIRHGQQVLKSVSQ